MEIALLAVLVIMNGFFSMSEIALVTARKSRMRRQIDEGDRGALAAVELGSAPTHFLSTLQVGITPINLLSGILAEATLAQPFGEWLQGIGVQADWSGWFATGIVVITMTYVSVVVGELVPKRLGQLHPEFIARHVARPVRLLAMMGRPVVKLFSMSTDLLLSIVGMKNQQPPIVTEEEIHALLEEGSDSGAIQASEHKMVRNVFRLDDRVLGSLMVPRADIVCLDVNLPWEENRRRIEQGDHTRFPVVRGSLDNILGVAKARRLLGRVVSGETPDISAGLNPPLFVPENLTGMGLLENFRASGVQLAFVVDEYGEVLGIVTLRDVLEAITGEFKPRNQEDAWAVQRGDGSWLLDGLIPIPELKDHLELDSVPDEASGHYQTLSGMVMLLLGRIPRTADVVEWQGWKLEVVDIDGKRVDKVLALRTAVDQGADPGAKAT